MKLKTIRDYLYENNAWYRNGKQLKDNAHIQLSRAKGKIIQLRDEAGLHFNVEGAVIFTGDDFRLTNRKRSYLERNSDAEPVEKLFQGI